MIRPDHSDDTRQYNHTKREEYMRPGSICAVLAASVFGSMLSVADVGAQTRALPRFEVDAGWLKVPPQFRVGDVSSFAVNAQDEVFLLHRPRTLKPDQAAMAAPPVMVFDASGNYLRSWGGAGQGYEWIEREHGIHIDYKGFVWIGGNNCPASNLPGLKPVADDQLLKFTQDGKFVLQIGKSNQSKGNADTANVHRAADGWVNPTTNELFVADGYGNHRVIVFDADTGAFKRMWGAFSNKPADKDDCEIQRHTNFSDPGPDQFSIVHGLRVAKDGMVYVADREYRRVQMFSSDGKFIKQLVKPDTLFARNVTLSSDPEQQFLYVGDGKTIAIVDRKTLTLAGEINVPGMLGGGHHITTDSKGNLYVAATGNGAQKLAFKGMSTAGR
jgi:DNA-binding beta-propeller fold protein YncE